MDNLDDAAKERILIIKALRESEGTKSKAAELLGIKRSQAPASCAAER